MVKNSIHNESKGQSSYALLTHRTRQTLSVLVALFLITTGLLKVFSPSAAINTSRELFSWADNTLHILIGSLLPVVELGLGIMLLWQWKYKWVLAETTILFSLFFLISIYGQEIGVDSDCGCFGGVMTSSFGWGMLTRNGLLLLGVIFLSRDEFKKGAVDE